MEISDHPLFQNMEPQEYEEMRSAGGLRRAAYKKGSVILRAGSRTAELGILLSGEIHIENTDLWGNRRIMHAVHAGDAFAETYAFCRTPMRMDVTAAKDCEILFLNVKRLLHEGSSRKTWYPKILYNLLQLSAEKNLAWSDRMLCISSRNLREKIMTYLSAEAVKYGRREFVIPFDRQQMADYLNADRSALSKELGRMKKEGILTFRKNRFRLLRIND